jgi:hypothetical protein
MPPEIDQTNNIDRDDSLLDTEDVPYDKLMAMLSGGDGDPSDDIAFGATSDDAKPIVETVTVEDGLDLIDGAHSKKRSDSKVEAKTEAEAEPDPEQDGAPEAKQEAPAADDAEIDGFLSALPDTARTAVKARIGAADEILGLFKGRETEMQRFGVTPATAVGELLKIEQYSRTNPADYLAWAAGQLGGDPVETLSKAASRLGLKVVQAASDDDDPFEDPEVKAMRAELAAYKARESGPQLGPDAPQNRAMSDLEAFRASAPHFDAVAEYVAAQASAHVQKTGKPVGVADLKRFYDANVQALGLEPSAPESKSAAQVQQPVAQQTQKPAAAPSNSVQRAMAASKSLDGSGHGAGRRPALAPDANLVDVLKFHYGSGSGS